MRFAVCGPYDLPKNAHGRIDLSGGAKNSLTEKIEQDRVGTADGCGCYIFSVKTSGRGSDLPWYVGQANKSSLLAEALNRVNLLQYNLILADYLLARPLLYMVPRLTDGGKVSSPSKSPSGHRDLHELEALLIGIALKRNPDLLNKKKTKWLRELELPGILTPLKKGKPTRFCTHKGDSPV